MHLLLSSHAAFFAVLSLAWFLAGTPARAQEVVAAPPTEPGAPDVDGGSASDPPEEAPAADESDDATPSSGPERVTVGMYVNQIYELSLKDNNLVVDFWIWFRWNDEELKPYESFELKNARIDSQSEPTVTRVGDVNYAYLRVVANQTHFWDVSAYPFDNHVVKLQIEDADNEREKVVYVADADASGLSDDVRLLTFRVWGGRPEIGESRYHSNYGDPSLAATNESVYSRFTMPLMFERAGVGYFFKLFFGLFVAAGIAFLAFFIKPTDLDPRFGLGVGAIFAAIASEYMVVGSLAESATLSLADKLHIIAFSAIFLSIIESTISLHFFTSGREELSVRIDRMSAVVVPATYVILTILAVQFR